jgi:hypothetical protein
VFLLLVALSTGIVGDVEVVDRKLGFELRLPSGFETFPEGRQQPGVEHAFARGRPGSDSRVIVLLSGLRGALPRDIPLPDPDSVEGQMFTFEARWKREFTIPVVCTRQKVDGMSTTVMVAQVPLSPRALMIKLISDSSQEAEMRELMFDILQSLEGPTNWLTSRERKDRFVQATLQLMGLLAAVVAFVVWFFRSRRNRSLPESRPSA